ncbi:unnamed protein product [Diamesa serratosioi]
MKVILVILLIACTASAVKAMDLFRGEFNQQSRLLFAETIDQADRRGGKSARVVKFNSTDPSTKISFISVVDLNNDKLIGGEAVLSKGGIGENFIQLILKSTIIGKGFNFRVEIYDTEDIYEIIPV